MFEGTMRDGLKQGQGTQVEGRTTYKGPFVNGLKEGRGVLTRNDCPECDTCDKVTTTHAIWKLNQLHGIVTVTSNGKVEDTVYDMGEEVIFG